MTLIGRTTRQGVEFWKRGGLAVRFAVLHGDPGGEAFTHAGTGLMPRALGPDCATALLLTQQTVVILWSDFTSEGSGVAGRRLAAL
jgi:hypothetical protein